jgi:hypothetical protein
MNNHALQAGRAPLSVDEGPLHPTVDVASALALAEWDVTELGRATADLLDALGGKLAQDGDSALDELPGALRWLIDSIALDLGCLGFMFHATLPTSADGADAWRAAVRKKLDAAKCPPDAHNARLVAHLRDMAARWSAGTGQQARDS